MNKFKSKYLNHKEAVDNFVWRTVQLFTKQGMTFLIFILCAFFLDPHAFGTYNYILAVVLFLVMFGDFGISTATSKYAAEYNVDNQEKLRRVFFNSLTLVLSFGAIVAILTILFGEYFLRENYHYILYLLPMLFLAPISSLYDGIFRGLKRFRELAIISISSGILSIGVVYFLIANYDLVGALVSQSFFYLVLVIISFFFYGKFSFEFDKDIAKNVLNYSVLVGLANLGYFFYTQVDLVMLGYSEYTEETGYYGLITRLFNLSLVFFAIFGHVVAPNHIKLQVMKKYDDLKRRIKTFSFYSFILGIIFAVILFLIVPPIMAAFLPQYDHQAFYAVFYIFLLVIPISVVEASLANGFITPLGYVKILTTTILIGGALNVLCNILFLYHFGYLGIIIATVVVHNLINITKFIYFWKVFRV